VIFLARIRSFLYNASASQKRPFGRGAAGAFRITGVAGGTGYDHQGFRGIFAFAVKDRPFNRRREGMKKTVFALLLVLFWVASSAVAAELKVGDKAPDFKLKDSTGKEYSLEHPQFKGKVLYIGYVDPDEKDTNNHVEDALKKEKEAGGLDKTRYEGFGIVNLKASLMPNFLIKSAIKSKQEKTGAIIILDLDYAILNLWGLKNDASNVVVLDKERICRYVNSGKLPPEELAKMIQIIKEYQAK
jgi:hypothetical protein